MDLPYGNSYSEASWVTFVTLAANLFPEWWSDTRSKCSPTVSDRGRAREALICIIPPVKVKPSSCTSYSACRAQCACACCAPCAWAQCALSSPCNQSSLHFSHCLLLTTLQINQESRVIGISSFQKGLFDCQKLFEDSDDKSCVFVTECWAALRPVIRLAAVSMWAPIRDCCMTQQTNKRLPWWLN